MIFKRKKRFLDGKKFGKLTVLTYVGDRKSECICDCGNKKIISESNLQSGNIKSCGCLRSIHRKNYDEDMKQKLFSKIKQVNDCWEWQGSLHRQGYGNFPYKNSGQLAHRVSWILFNGEIPSGMNICHKCDNPPCVNPDHLFVGSYQDNINDMFRKGRKNHQGENHPKVKLSSSQVLEIRELLNKKITQEEICKKYGITNGHVGSIKHKRTWKLI